MVLRLLRDLPGAPGFLATVVPEKLASQELDTSVGVSGPHDLAVRLERPRLGHRPRPPHPAPRQWRWPTPLWWDGMGAI